MKDKNPLEEVSKNFRSKIGKEISVDDVRTVWNTVAKHVSKSLRNGTGVMIKDVGTFSLTEVNTSVGLKGTVKSTRPVFLPSEKMVQNYNLKEIRPYTSCKIPVKALNISVITDETGKSREVVEDCVLEVVQSFVRLVGSNMNAEFPFAGIGKLQVKNKNIHMKFYDKFLENFGAVARPPDETVTAKQMDSKSVLTGPMTPLEKHKPTNGFNSVLPVSKSSSAKMSSVRGSKASLKDPSKGKVLAKVYCLCDDDGGRRAVSRGPMTSSAYLLAKEAELEEKRKLQKCPSQLDLKTNVDCKNSSNTNSHKEGKQKKTSTDSVSICESSEKQTKKSNGCDPAIQNSVAADKSNGSLGNKGNVCSNESISCPANKDVNMNNACKISEKSSKSKKSASKTSEQVRSTSAVLEEKKSLDSAARRASPGTLQPVRSKGEKGSSQSDECSCTQSPTDKSDGSVKVSTEKLVGKAIKSSVSDVESSDSDDAPPSIPGADPELCYMCQIMDFRNKDVGKNAPHSGREVLAPTELQVALQQAAREQMEEIKKEEKREKQRKDLAAYNKWAAEQRRVALEKEEEDRNKPQGHLLYKRPQSTRETDPQLLIDLQKMIDSKRRMEKEAKAKEIEEEIKDRKLKEKEAACLQKKLHRENEAKGKKIREDLLVQMKAKEEYEKMFYPDDEPVGECTILPAYRDETAMRERKLAEIRKYQEYQIQYKKDKESKEIEDQDKDKLKVLAEIEEEARAEHIYKAKVEKLKRDDLEKTWDLQIEHKKKKDRCLTQAEERVYDSYLLKNVLPRCKRCKRKLGLPVDSVAK